MKMKKVCLLLLVTMSLITVGCSNKKEKSLDDVVNEVEEIVEEEIEEPEVEEEPEIEEEPEEVEEVVEEKVPAKKSDLVLSDDLYSFQIEIDGQVLQLPMSYDELIGYGWKYSDDDSMEMEPNQYTTGEVIEKDGTKLYAEFINFGINVEPINNCYVGGFSMDYYYLDNSDMKFVLPGGIEIGVSTLEDVKAAYGEPTSTYDGEMYTLLTYEYDSYQDIDIYVYVETGAVETIDIRNFVATEEQMSDTSEVSDEVPDVVSNYIAPTELGDDFSSFIVEFAGDLYKLPAPVSEFEKNGWKIIEDSSNMVIKAQSYGWVTLMKDNQKMDVTVHNYADNATAANNCFIDDVEGDDNETNLPITIQKKITKGMSEADLKKILKNVDNVEVEKTDTFTYYTIIFEELGTDKIDILVKNETKIVQGIEVNHGYTAEEQFMNQ